MVTTGVCARSAAGANEGKAANIRKRGASTFLRRILRSSLFGHPSLDDAQLMAGFATWRKPDRIVLIGQNKPGAENAEHARRTQFVLRTSRVVTALKRSLVLIRFGDFEAALHGWTRKAALEPRRHVLQFVE